MEILDHLLSEEVRSKRPKRYETKLRYSSFPFRKTIDEFDFSFQPSIDKSVINDLMTLRFIHNRENLVFLGPPGVGKTHLSVAIGMHALQSDISVYYVSVAKLVQALRKEFMRDDLNALLRKYARYPLMVIDEIGYLPLNRRNQIFSSRWYPTGMRNAPRSSPPTSPSRNGMRSWGIRSWHPLFSTVYCTTASW